MDLFNAGEWFEAHEVVEDLWNETDGPDREFLKGFIQAAVALEHHRRGNLPGFRSVCATALPRLRAAPPDAGGLEIARLAEDLESFRIGVGKGGAPAPPRARWWGPPPAEEQETP